VAADALSTRATVTLLGAEGNWVIVTVEEETDGPSPTVLEAVTVTWYVEPKVRPLKE
jgi:hypothetical protein